MTDEAEREARTRQATAAMFGEPRWDQLTDEQQAAAIDKAATYLARINADPIPEEWFA